VEAGNKREESGPISLRLKAGVENHCMACAVFKGKLQAFEPSNDSPKNEKVRAEQARPSRVSPVRRGLIFDKSM
jgi:hypothetical protein